MKFKNPKFVFRCCLALILSLALMISFLVYKNITFDIEIGSRMKRAADANTVEIAVKELDVVIDNIEKRGLETGTTSVLYSTPACDLDFWYNNIKASRDELRSIQNDKLATIMDKTNALIKLRESLINHTGQNGETINIPPAAAVHPYNVVMTYAILIWCFFGATILIMHNY